MVRKRFGSVSTTARSRFSSIKKKAKTISQRASQSIRARVGASNIPEKRKEAAEAQTELARREEEAARLKAEQEKAQQEAQAKYDAEVARQVWFNQQLKDLRTKYENQPQDSVRRQMTPEEASIYVKAASSAQHADFSQTTSSVRTDLGLGEAVVSDSILEDLRARAAAGDKTAQQALTEVTGSVPVTTQQVIKRALTGDELAIKELERVGINPQTGKPYGTVIATPEPEGIIEKTKAFISRQRGKITTTRAREERFGAPTFEEGVAGFGLGALSSGVGTLEFGQELVTDPGSTLLNVGSAAKGLVTGTTDLSFLGQTIREEPGFALGFVGAEVATDIALGKAAVKATDFGSAQISRVTEKATDLKTTVFGEQFIGDIPLKQPKLTVDATSLRGATTIDTRDFSKLILGKIDNTPPKLSVDVDDIRGVTSVDTNLVTEKFFGKPKTGIELGVITGRDDILKVRPLEAVDEFASGIKLKQDPSIPKLSGTQKDVFDILKRQDDAVFSGSFAAEAQVEGVRKFKDIDSLFSDPKKVADIVKAELGSDVKIVKQQITGTKFGDFDIYRVVDPKTGRVLADIDPLKFGEEGFLKKFGTVEVDGVLLADPKARLASKVEQIGKQPVGKIQKKVLTDVEQLTGAPLTQQPAFISAFGFSAEFMKQFVGKKGPVTSSAQGLVPFLGDDVVIKQTLFGTPFEVISGKPTGRGLVRKTFLQKGKKGANLLDILTEDVSLGRGRPQIALFEDASITEKGGKGSFSVIRKTSGELELTAGPKPGVDLLTSDVEIVRKVGRSKTVIIDGKKVPIISTELDVASPELSALVRKRRAGTITPEEAAKFEELRFGETGFTQKEVEGLRNQNIELSKGGLATSGLATFSPTVSRKKIDFSSLQESKISQGRFISSRVRPAISSKDLVSRISRVESRITSPVSASSFVSKSSGTSGISGGSGTSGFSGFSSGPGFSPRPRIIPPPIIKPVITPGKISLSLKPKKIKTGTFRIEVKRQGKFKTIGRRKTLGQAFSLGAGRVGKTLAATFRIRGGGKLTGGFKLPKTIKRKKGKVLTFLEIPGARLDTPGEIKEIQLARGFKL